MMTLVAHPDKEELIMFGGEYFTGKQVSHSLQVSDRCAEITQISQQTEEDHVLFYVRN